MAYGSFIDKGFQADLDRLFNSIPPKMRDKSIARIYAKALIRMRNAIRSNVPVASEAHVFSRKGGKVFKYNPGTLRKSVSIRALRKQSPADDPAAMVYVKSGRSAAWYGYFVEYGLNRGDKSSAGFFRGGVDAASPSVRMDVERAIKVYAQRELDKEVDKWNRKVDKMIIKL